jgi:hypothetical protein
MTAQIASRTVGIHCTGPEKDLCHSRSGWPLTQVIPHERAKRVSVGIYGV